MSKNPFERQVELQKVQPRVSTPKVPNADNPAPSRRGKKGITIYFDVDTHRVLRELSLEHDKAAYALVLEGVNLMFREYGRKPIA